MNNREFLFNKIFILISPLIVMLSALYISRFVAYNYGTEGLGKYGILNLFCILVGNLFGFGINNVIIKYLDTPENLKRDLPIVRSFIYASLLASYVVVSILFVIYSHFLFNRSISLYDIILIDTCVMAIIINAIFLNIAVVTKRMHSILLCNVFNFLSVIIFLNAFEHKINMTSLITILLASYLPSAISYIVFMDKESRRIIFLGKSSLSSFYPMFIYGVKASFGSSAGLVTQLSIPAILASLSSLGDAGIYRAATNLTGIYSAVFGAIINQSFYPSISRSKGDMGILSDVINKQILLILIMSTSCFLLIKIFGMSAIVLIFGLSFHGSFDVLILLALVDIVKLSTFPLSLTILLLKPSIYSAMEFMAAAILISSSYFMVDGFGIMGAVAAYALVYIIYTVIICIYFGKAFEGVLRSRTVFSACAFVISALIIWRL